MVQAQSQIILGYLKPTFTSIHYHLLPPMCGRCPGLRLFFFFLLLEKLHEAVLYKMHPSLQSPRAMMTLSGSLLLSITQTATKGLKDANLLGLHLWPCLGTRDGLLLEPC